MQLLLLPWYNSHLLHHILIEEDPHTFIQQYFQKQTRFVDIGVIDLNFKQLDGGCVKDMLGLHIYFLW